MRKPVDRRTYRLRPDAKGRITLGKLAEGVSSYRARRQEDGTIVLEPFVEIPADERWLYQDKKALETIRKGLADAKAGRLTRITGRKAAELVDRARRRARMTETEALKLAFREVRTLRRR